MLRGTRNLLSLLLLLVAATTWARGSTVKILKPLPCSFFGSPRDSLEVHVRVSLESFASADYTKSDESHSRRLLIFIEGPTTAAYDYDVPPTPHLRGKTWAFCSQEGGSWVHCAEGKAIQNDNISKFAGSPKVKSKGSSLELRLPCELRTGFYRMAARIDDVWSSGEKDLPITPLAGVDDVFFAVHGDDEYGNDIMVNAYHNAINKTSGKAGQLAADIEKLNVRADYFQLKYKHKRVHPEIFSFSPEVLDPLFRQAIELEDPQLLASVVEPLSQHGIFKFKLFTDEMRSKLRRELQFFNAESMKWPRKPSRPNSMNNYGLMLNEVGLSSPMIDDMARQYLFKLAKMLLPDWAGEHMDHQHSFLVQYSSSEDVSLDKHMDQSAVTVNVCLGDDYKGGNLLFEGQRGHWSEGQNFTIHLEPGEAVMHAGQHWHRVLPVESGEKQNVVIWMRSTHLRDSSAEKFGVACPNLHARSTAAEETTRSKIKEKEKAVPTQRAKTSGSKSDNRSSDVEKAASRHQSKASSSTKSSRSHQKNGRDAKSRETDAPQKRQSRSRAQRSSSQKGRSARQDEL